MMAPDRRALAPHVVLLFKKLICYFSVIYLETCEAGEEFIDQTLNIGCKPCDRGYYHETPPTSSSKTCLPCPAGESTELNGATSETLCQGKKTMSFHWILCLMHDICSQYFIFLCY